MASVQSQQNLVSEMDLKFLNKIILGMIGFGLCFTFLGTMLGGIWADQSWGRFWGWDPKENGALLIILWTAITLHARLAGYIKDFGVAVFAIIGTMVVMLSWFGVNLLGVGLHSYGFTEGLVINLLSYFFIEFVFIFVVIFLQRRFLNKMKS
jgi:ABC-type transport system involved in cytochrome c biogenesis permease subunit